MMSADECRAKAEELSRFADTATSYDVVLECESMAREWRKLALVAEWQDAIQRRLDSEAARPQPDAENDSSDI